MIIKYFKRDYTKNSITCTFYEVIEFHELIIDPISNEAFSISVSGENEYKKNDIAIIDLNGTNYFFIVDKVSDKFKISLKSILNSLSQEDIIDPINIKFSDLINNFFKINSDTLLNLPFLTFENIDVGYNSYLSVDKKVTSEMEVNYFSFFTNTILKNKRTMNIYFKDSKTSNFVIKFEEQTPISMNLNSTMSLFFATIPEIPEVNNGTNVLKIIEITKLTKLDNTEIIKSKVITNYYLTNEDKVVTPIPTSDKRVIPVNHETIIVEIKQKEVDNDGTITIESDQPVDKLKLAEEKMSNTSQYSISFYVWNDNRTIDVTSLKLFQVFDFWTSESEKIRTVLTGMVIKKQTTELRFGLERQDLIFALNKIKGGKKWQ